MSVVFTGCGKDPAKIIDEVKELKDQACSCKDAECGDKAMADFEAYFTENKGKSSGASEEQEKELAKLGTELGMCLVKAGVSPQKLKELGEKMQAD